MHKFFLVSFIFIISLVLCQSVSAVNQSAMSTPVKHSGERNIKAAQEINAHNNPTAIKGQSLFQAVISVVQILIAISMAFIAGLALKTWKNQIKANRRLDFIDELTDTIHAFMQAMSAPISYMHFAKIGIDSYTGIHSESKDIKNPEAVAFIKKQGKSTGENILKSMSGASEFLSKIKSLEAKGQVFGIKKYHECRNACQMLTWSYNQIEFFTVIIGDPCLNWKNPTVQESLDKVLLIEPESIRKNLYEQNIKLLSFARGVYSEILK